MADRSLVVVSGGLRHPSATRLLADQIAVQAVAALTGGGVSADVRVVDLREHAHDVMNALLTGFAAPALREVLDALSAADGLIAVSPVFNASFSGLFKTFFDVVDKGSLVDTPVLLAATGGTPRHSLALEHALRPLFVYLRAIVIPTAVYASSEDWASGQPRGGIDARLAAPDWASAAAEDGRTDAEPGAPGTSLRDRIRRAAREFAEQVHRGRPRAPTDPFALTTPFDQLLSPGVPAES